MIYLGTTGTEFLSNTSAGLMQIGNPYQHKEGWTATERTYVSSAQTCTQSTAAVWPSKICTGDPTPPEVRFRRSNMRTVLSADLEEA